MKLGVGTGSVADARSVPLKGYYDPMTTYPVTSLRDDSDQRAEAVEGKRP
jgi:hypothetical protein